MATGRPICSIESLMAVWGINEEIIDLVIGLNGGHIKDYRLNKEKLNFPIKGQLIKKVVQHFDGYPVNFGVYYENYVAVYRDDALALRLANSDNIPYKVVNFEEIYKNHQSKLIVLCHPIDMPTISEHGKKITDPEMKSLQAGKIEYEYMNPKLSKSVSIQEVCKWHHITLDEVLAFGDADNDADMIKDVGCGVAMANGSHLTKSYANKITLSHQEDGVAVYLEKNLLNKR